MLNVLLVDDNHENRFLNARLLQQLGCNVTEFPDTSLPLKLLQRRNPFDVIFTDFNMPKMNGIEFFDWIRGIYPDAPVVITSVTDYPELRALARKKGVPHYIFGQFDRAPVQDVLNKIIHL